MHRTASPDGIDSARPADAGRAPFASRVRSAAASFWLSVLFRLTRSAPGLVGALKPLSVRLAVRFSRKIRSATFANARRIIGPEVSPARQRTFARAVVGSFYDFVAEFGRSSQATREELTARIESVHNIEAYHAARALGKGAIVVTAHMGSFEVGLAALRQYEQHIHVVFKRDPFAAFERLRHALHQRLNVAEATIDEGWPMWLRLRDALQRNEVVAIQGDRVIAGQKGVRVKFLGGHLLLPSGPVKLALASGAPIIPIFSVRSGRDKIRIFIEDAIIVPVESQGDALDDSMHKLAAALAKYVVANPEQWLVLDRAFCEDHPTEQNTIGDGGSA